MNRARRHSPVVYLVDARDFYPYGCGESARSKFFANLPGKVLNNFWFGM